MASKAPARERDPVTRLRYVPDAEYERRCRLAREGVSVQGKEAAKLLRKADVLVGVEESRYREGVSRAAVEDKLGEPLVDASWWFKQPSRRADQIGRIQRLEKGYRRAAGILRHAGASEWPEHLEADARWMVGHEMNVRGWPPHPDLAQPTQTFRRRKMNRLVIELLAILRHTTNLTVTYMAQDVLPGILGVATRHYDAPPSTDESTWSRYKTLAAEATHRELSPDDQLFHFRVALFAGDDRFPSSLFKPHRPRNVPRK